MVDPNPAPANLQITSASPSGAVAAPFVNHFEVAISDDVTRIVFHEIVPTTPGVSNPRSAITMSTRGIELLANGLLQLLKDHQKAIAAHAAAATKGV